MNRAFQIVLIAILGFSGNAYSQQPKDSITVISYNIWDGFTGKDSTRFDKFVNWVKDKDPDVLALQELVGYDSTKLATQAKLWGHNYSYIAKTGGYPVGITSNSPITLKERILEGMWHGALRCSVYGIDFFVVHLSPADQAFRKKEADILKDYINSAMSDSLDVVVLGDYNSVSIADIDKLSESDSLLTRYRKGKSNKYNNLLSGQFDFSVMSIFTSISLVDVAPYFMSSAQRYSFPAPALIGIWQTEAEVKRNLHRIDYILFSPELGNRVGAYTIFHDSLTGSLSDHYPVYSRISLK